MVGWKNDDAHGAKRPTERPTDHTVPKYSVVIGVILEGCRTGKGHRQRSNRATERIMG